MKIVGNSNPWCKTLKISGFQTTQDYIWGRQMIMKFYTTRWLTIFRETGGYKRIHSFTFFSNLIFNVKFFQVLEKQTPKLASWNLAIAKRNKVRKFGFGSPDHVTTADRFMVEGAVMAPLQ